MSESTDVRVLVPLAHGVEEMEAVTCIDLFRRAGWTVVGAGMNEVVQGSRDVNLVRDVSLSAALNESWDVICIPGGTPGVEALLKEKSLLESVREHWKKNRFVAAVCAGPLVLHQAGVLGQSPFTCHPSVSSQFAPEVPIETDVVVSGNIITGCSAGAAMDFALAVIREVGGQALFEEVSGSLCRR